MHNDYSGVGAFIGAFMAYSVLWTLLAWLACSFIAGYLVAQKGGCAPCWFILGLVFGPLALIGAAGMPDRKLLRTVAAVGRRLEGTQPLEADGAATGEFAPEVNESDVTKRPGFWAGMGVLVAVIVVLYAIRRAGLI